MNPISESSWLRCLLLGFSISALVTTGSVQADLAAYGVFKGENYFQEGASAPGASQLEDYGVSAFALLSPQATPFLILVQPQGDDVFPLILQSLDDGPEWFGEEFYSTAAERDEGFPDGMVTFQMLGFTGSTDATMMLATPLGSALPPVPAVVNYAQAQAIDPTQAFTLQWNNFTGAGAQDVIWVQVESGGGVVFSTPIPGAPGALSGTATQVVIPAGTLSGQDYILATISFLKVGAQTVGSLPNSTALAGSYRRTSVELTLADDGGNGDPTDGPVLISTEPASGSMNVVLNTEVQFQFSRSMAPTVDIIWRANGNELSANAFSYSWSGDGSSLVATYSPSFPPSAIITWELGDGFEDTDGEPLAGEVTFGFFMTGAGNGNGNGDCEGGDPLDQEGTFSFLRGLMFVQTGPGTVVPVPEDSALFAVVFNPPAEFAVTGASFTPPAGEQVPMHRFFGATFFFVDAFESETELNEVHPLGNYVARVQPQVGSAITTTVTLSGASVPVPEVMNYTAGQAIDPAAPFTLTWNPFTGADASAFIYLDIADSEGDTVFSAPDECIGLELAPTATSIAVPVGTFQPGRIYEMTLSFYRITDNRQDPASEITFLAGQGAITETTLRTIGGDVAEDYRLSEARIGAGGTFQAIVSGTAGTVVEIQSSADLITWEPVTTLSLPGSGSTTFEDPNLPNPGAHRFYRILGP
jgi:hypothetical protein